MSIRSKLRSFLTSAALAAGVFVAAAPSPARAAGLLVADGGFGGVLEVKEHDVKVVINNGVAVTTVTQIFQNMEDRQVEALYTFPVPKGASVANFSMWIGGKEMVGEVLEKKRAREIYDSYKQTRRDPGLLEQTNYRTFEMRIFPIAPRAEQRVQIAYYQELNVDNDWATYVYPLATATRTDINSKTTGKFALTVDARSEIPIKEMESPSHPNDFAVATHAQGYRQASLEATGGDLNRDVVLAYLLSRPKTGLDMVTSKRDGEDGYFSLTMTAGEELAAQNAGMDYVFILDVSGSMNEAGKLDLSRNALSAFSNALGDKDRFEIIAFNVSTNALFKQLTPADEGAKKRAVEFMASLNGRGGTVLNPAMSAAYKYADGDRPLNVILLSDGMTEQRERQQLASIIRSRPKGARVFCIGVGNDVNRGLLEQVASDTGGLASFVSKQDNFERQAAAFRRKLMRPVASDIKIDFGGIEVYDLEPKQLPSLYHGMPVRLYGRYKKSGPVNVTVAGNVMGQPIKQSVQMDLPKRDDANPEIERMWAWKRVDRLLNEADAGGSRTSVLDEIVRLGEGYSIVTEYTSFIVLENDAEYQRWQIDRRNVTRLGRDRAAQQEVSKRLELMRDKAAEQLGPMTDEQLVDASGALPPSVRKPDAAANPARQQQPAPSNTPRRNSRDFSLPGGGGGGGGAIDPISAGAALLLAGVALVAGRSRKSRRDE